MDEIPLPVRVRPHLCATCRHLPRTTHLLEKLYLCAHLLLPLLLAAFSLHSQNVSAFPRASRHTSMAHGPDRCGMYCTRPFRTCGVVIDK